MIPTDLLILIYVEAFSSLTPPQPITVNTLRMLAGSPDDFDAIVTSLTGSGALTSAVDGDGNTTFVLGPSETQATIRARAEAISPEVAMQVEEHFYTASIATTGDPFRTAAQAAGLTAADAARSAFVHHLAAAHRIRRGAGVDLAPAAIKAGTLGKLAAAALA